jgi:hypothetical protein
MFKSKIKILVIILVGLAMVAYRPIERSTECGFSRFEGFRAYLFFSENYSLPENIDMSTEPCGREFYLGLYQAATFFKPDMNRVEKICEKVNLGLPKRLWNGCYFNLGTSAVYKKVNEHSSWEEIVSVTDTVVDFCNNLPGFYYHCAAGAYNGINIAYHDNPLLPVKDNNPLIFCKEIRHKNYEYQCMRNMVSYLNRYVMSNYNFAIESIEKMSLPAGKMQEIKITYFSSLAFEGEILQAEITKLCSGYENKELRGACIQGYVTGLVENSLPGTEPESIANFCLQNIFSTAEQGECIRRGFTELPSDDKVGECYKKVPKGLKNYCDKV